MSIPKPYYDDGRGIVIYHGDAREIMPLVAAQVMITDPPYGINYHSNMVKPDVIGSVARGIVGDEDTTLRDFALATFRGPAAAFASWKCRPWGTPRGCLVWDKGGAGGMGDLSFPWKCSFELVYVYGQGWTGHRDSSILRGSIVPPNGGRHGRQHPHEKSVEVLMQIIDKAPSGTVLDPFMGSGTTLRAAKDLGRKAIGIEIEERYCEIAAKRLAQEAIPFRKPDDAPRQQEFA